jgi:predicted DNA-binding antitoxin AbrB/MazE fold protein
MERSLGRSLKPNERVSFSDGDRTNLELENLILSTKKEKTKAAKKAQLEAKRDEIQAQLEELG